MQKIGILIINIGTPKAPTTKAVRHYLKEFLSDPRIVELPTWLWRPILYGVILPFRSKTSAQLYQRIWSGQGSPLLHNSIQQAKKLQQLLALQSSQEIVVSLGMRYGTPSIEQALKELQLAKVQKIIILPLYPQYSGTTTASSFDAIAKTLKQWRLIPKLHFIDHYSDHPLYIETMVNQIRQHGNPTAEKLLFSFHSIPQRYVAAGDPYYDQCKKTVTLILEKLSYSPENALLVFQSRIGKQKWLQPYCDQTLKQLAKQGIKSVDVVCPGFAADCVETLEEIAIRNHEYFIKAGGVHLNYIPALNYSPDHINTLASIVKPYIISDKGE